jgi:CBS domain-containing membrane protein
MNRCEIGAPMDERAISEWTPRRRYAEHGPAGMADVLRGVGLRLRWRRLVEQHQARLPLGFLALVNGATSIGLMAVAAQLTHEPLVFPSLGPDSVPPLLHRPHTEVSCPRNALLGHLMGALAGPTSLTMFGLWRHGPALYRMTAGRTCAAALSLGLTAAAMIWAGTPHPPAGATTDGATERRPRSSNRSLNASSGNS